MKMGLKIILFVYSWLYCCITELNLWNTFFWTNYLLLLNENLLNFTICRNTKLKGAKSGPDRVPILQAQICVRSGKAFHYWSGARQITLSGPHFFWLRIDRRPTKISARDDALNEAFHYLRIKPLKKRLKIKQIKVAKQRILE